MRKFILLILTVLLSNVAMALPKGFVYLEQIDPSIIVDLRYAGEHNFLGRNVEGYEINNRAILTEQAAYALKNAQAKFNKDGYSIVVYDAYRPQRAVNSFMSWSKDVKDQKQKSLFYPRVDKARVFELGYVAEKSSHSRGSTVDISIIKLGDKLHTINPVSRKLLDDFEVFYLEDGTVDMGTSFDLFDKASHYKNDLISDEHKKMRKYLKEVMESCGFSPYAEEWWHFTLNDEPFKDEYMDFMVK
jgi:D-alanyl-D-alanine dipeptidase